MRVAEESRDVGHDDEEQHHEGQKQAGPADHDLGGDAERCGDQGDTDEVSPEEAEGHVVGDDRQDDVDAPDVESAEDGHGDGKGEVGEGDDLLDGAGLGQVGAGGDQGYDAGEDAGDTHGERYAGKLKDADGKGCWHVDPRGRP